MGSLKCCLDFQKDLKGLLLDGSNLEREDSELFGFISDLENPKGVLDQSRIIKDDGNSSFKEGDFDGALEKYSLSCVFLSCVVLHEEDARASFSQLASTVVLNMAASLLKKKEFRQVGHLCSVVFNHNPENVKALFRRACAAIGLGEYVLACWDLRLARKVDFSNQEVEWKLKEVEQILHSPPKDNHGQGKKKLEEYGPVEPVNVSVEIERDSKQNEREDIICNDFDHCNMMEVDKSDGKVNVMEIDRAERNSKTKEVEMCERVNDKEVEGKRNVSDLKVEKSKYHFRNRRKPESALVISRSDYQILTKGRTIQHLNPRSGIVMSIRIIGNPQETSTKSRENHNKQNSHSPSEKHGEHIHHKSAADNVAHDPTHQSERNPLTETTLPGPEKVEMNQPTEVAPMLTDFPPRDTPLDQSPSCFHSSATGNRSLFTQSITTGNRSHPRRVRNRAPGKGVARDRRIKHRNPSSVLYNHDFQCRSKIEASFKFNDWPPPNSQNLLTYRSGMKRKYVLLQSPDLPQQPRKLLIIKNENCNSCSSTVCSLPQVNNFAGCKICVRM